MKVIKIFFIVGCLGTAILLSGAIAIASFRKTAVGNNDKGFALIELFTSEGCSSCPPADELVARIQREETGQPVYILAFHVDYWNRLGWKDVYSNADYSKRQNQYASWLNLRSVYTPQIVVNGQQEFVGSEETTLRNAIKSSLRKISAAKLILDQVDTSGRQFRLHYQANGADGHTDLLLALVQHSAQTRVKSGENGGHLLSHIQIVRQLKQIPLNGKNSGTASLDIPQHTDAAKYGLIAFLQHDTDGEIIAATRYK
ncbi:DUF1223 domain-containing protein [Pedobacter cryoconitis]|uniref:Uncharacterized protein n=1 Tax=Pedobacter cryoconitis TaxID=188932 RepID=A0A7X0MJW2_9SPHI|nr:DUF1223 domain-containing protein [Pedobacter cryoconitis]MBB6501917.1 hypothetical protein [Pedobacter cryoconitis]